MKLRYTAVALFFAGACLAPAGSHAVALVLNASTCTGVLAGIWDALSRTCTASAVTIPTDDSLTINSSTTLVSTGTSVNKGTINVGSLFSPGTLRNQGLLRNEGTLDNLSVLENNNRLENHAVLINGFPGLRASLINRGLLLNVTGASLTNESSLENSSGVISNLGSIDSDGEILNLDAGSGSPSIQNESPGVISIGLGAGGFCFSGCRLVNVSPEATIENRFGGQITVNESGTLLLEQGELINRGDAIISNLGITDVRLPAKLLNDGGGNVVNNQGASLLIRGQLENSDSAIVFNYGGMLIQDEFLNAPGGNLLNPLGGFIIVTGTLRNQDFAFVWNRSLILSAGVIANFCDAEVRNDTGALILQNGNFDNWGGTVTNDGQIFLPPLALPCLHEPP